ncbi:hypothetical protein llap_2530 [Limosa lapponica baueri]|uniref:Uncharacterized protein n=1 Tax=Limosa lapponica baueri TaxID=1758121 RepID=A0A2I0UM89_LIMLA|nr:hypothetical protein llap_2530 [Limosa lapponica baueri]
MLRSSHVGPKSLTAFEPVAQHTFGILCVAQLCYHHYDPSTLLQGVPWDPGVSTSGLYSSQPWSGDGGGAQGELDFSQMLRASISLCSPGYQEQSSWSKAGKKRQASTFCSPFAEVRLRKRKGNTEFHAQKGPEQQKKRKKTGSKLEGSLKTALAEAEKSQQADEVVFNIYRKAGQEMQHPWVQRLLQMPEKGLQFQLEVQKLRNMDTKLVWRWYRTGLMPHGAWLLQNNCPQPRQVFQLTLQVAMSTENLGRALQVVKCSLLKDALLPPPPELFDELWGLAPQRPPAALGCLLESLAADVT